jgi:hypothetical protein
VNPTPEQIAETEAKEAAAGQRVQQLLADPAVKQAFHNIENQYLAEFASADSDEKRRDVWAKSRVLRDLTTALAAAVTDGAFAEHKTKLREEAEAVTRRQHGRTPRR